MLANVDKVCRGDMLESGVVMSGELFSERVAGRQSSEFTVRFRGELKAGCSLWPFWCCSMLLAQLSRRSGLLINFSSLLRRPGLVVLSSFNRLPSVQDFSKDRSDSRSSRDLLLGSCFALKSSR